MWPTLVEWEGGAGVHTYGLLVLLAFCCAFLAVHARSQQVGMHPDRLIAVYVAAAVGGILGGRLLYAVAVEPAQTFADPTSLFSLAGFAFYGGVIGGAMAVGLLARVQGLPAWKLADIAAPAVVLGLGVGRLGCFFAGCCHGAPAPVGAPRGLLPESFPGGQIWVDKMFPFLTLEFHQGVGRLHDIPLYPTQLWSAGAGIGLAIALSIAWSRWRRFDGQIAAVTLMIEPLFRGTIEAFRADHRGTLFHVPGTEALATWLPGMAQAGADLEATALGVTTSQAIGLAMVGLGLLIYVLRRHEGVAEERPIDPEESSFYP